MNDLIQRLQQHCDKYLVAPKNVFIEVDQILNKLREQDKAHEELKAKKLKDEGKSKK